MKKKKILLVDNDVIARRAVASVLSKSGNYKLFIYGETGKTEQFIIDHNPDLLLLGVRATIVEELALLSTVRVRFPDLPVVLLSERSEEGAAVAVAALRIGAFDFITKPGYGNSLLFANRHLEKRVIPIVRAGLKFSSGDGDTVGSRSFNFRSWKMEELSSFWPLSLIVIGGCTGATKVLFSLLSALPEDFAVPILIVQHFPKSYTRLLAKKLDEVSKLRVREAVDGAVVAPGTVWIARGGYHCEVQREAGQTTRLRVHRGPRESGVRPSIDMLFRSAGRLYGPDILGVVLSGCGKDGTEGAGIIQQAGGQIIVEDPRTALVPEMPLSVIESGYYDTYSTAEEIAGKLVALVAEKNATGSGKKSKPKPKQTSTHSRVRNRDAHLFSTFNEPLL